MSTTGSSSQSELYDTLTPLPPPASSLKRIRCSDSHEFWDSLQCAICYDIFRPPIVNCMKGHSFCLLCIEKMGALSGQDKCPKCKFPVDKSNRNWSLEGQLEGLTGRCSWRHSGCKERVSLGALEAHERECKFSPHQVPCLFADEIHQRICEWSGNAVLLPKHLKEQHLIETIERNKVVKFLWNPPKRGVNRFRYRPLEVSFPRGDKTGFLLEHVYLSEKDLCLFRVKALDPERKLNYKISLLNRTCSSNAHVFCGNTAYYGDTPLLHQFPELDAHQVLALNFYTVQDLCFLNPDDDCAYFSFHVEFLTNDLLTP